MVFFGGFYTTDGQQREAIARWSRQDVPIVLTQSGERFVTEFSSDYPALAAYLRAHYRRAGSLDVERSKTLDVWVANEQAFRVDDPTRLPCVANSQSSNDVLEPGP
jgi:hypothetical protein